MYIYRRKKNMYAAVHIKYISWAVHKPISYKILIKFAYKPKCIYYKKKTLQPKLDLSDFAYLFVSLCTSILCNTITG